MPPEGLAGVSHAAVSGAIVASPECHGPWQKLVEKVLDACLSRAPLRPEFVVADIGAGNGSLSLLLARRVAKVVAVDADKELLGMLSGRASWEGLDNIETSHGSAERLPLRDESVDAAFIHMSLHHFLDPEQALEEASRALRPGGWLVVADCHPPQRPLNADAHLEPTVEPGRLRAWFAGSGWSDVTIEALFLCCLQSGWCLGAGGCVYLATARKPGRSLADTTQPSYAANSIR